MRNHTYPFRTIIKQLIIGLLLMLVHAGKAYAAQPIKGRIVNEKNEGIAAAYIVLNQSVSAITDDKGYFSLPALKPGTYGYYASSLGYEEQRGNVEIKKDQQKPINIQLKPIALSINEVTVTARQQAMGSKSIIGQDAIRHIQPKSLADMLQLMPGSLTTNPTLNDLAQANIREIGSNENNAMGTAVIVDGTPLSNDGNFQTLSTSKTGGRSSNTADGMSQQTTAGKGVDLRTMGADNIESVEVIRGIPSVEYGNLTSGVVIVKTKSGKSPVEVKLKADPFSKLAYVGKGFEIKHFGTLNVGADWSQSYADTRRHYKGYDRITAAVGYSNIFNKNGKHPISLNINTSFYSNINEYKKDPQMREMMLFYKNKNMGGRIAIHGNIQMNNFLTAINYDFSSQIARSYDIHKDWVANPDGMVSNSTESGEHVATVLTKPYMSDYTIEGIPYNIYAQIKSNKYIQIDDRNFTNIKLGVEYRADGNKGDGLAFSMQAPPQSMGTQTLRPRSYKDIPAMQSFAGFVENSATIAVGKTDLRLNAGVRLSNLFVNRSKAGRNSIFVAEPRINSELTLLNSKNNKWFQKLSITGGYGISNKMPPLLYLYPDKAYFDNNSLSFSATADNNPLAVMTTKVIDQTSNPNLKPTRSRKWEVGINARIKRMKGYVTFFKEKHSNEFGFAPELEWLEYRMLEVPVGASNLQYDNGQVTYDYKGESHQARYTMNNEIASWGRPSNTGHTEKHGIEYAWDFGKFKPLLTSLYIDGAWFHIKRIADESHLNYINKLFDYVSLLPAGNGTVSERINTNFRFITHIPKVKIVFTTTLQVVWHESSQMVYEDKQGKPAYHLDATGEKYIVAPLGIYNKQGQWADWTQSMENDPKYSILTEKYLLYSFKKDNIGPWALINFRFTKELGKIAELSFMANNFLNIKKYHVNKHSTYTTQLYPSSYFGAELKLKL